MVGEIEKYILTTLAEGLPERGVLLVEPRIVHPEHFSGFLLDWELYGAIRERVRDGMAEDKAVWDGEPAILAYRGSPILRLPGTHVEFRNGYGDPGRLQVLRREMLCFRLAYIDRHSLVIPATDGMPKRNRELHRTVRDRIAEDLEVQLPGIIEASRRHLGQKAQRRMLSVEGGP